MSRNAFLHKLAVLGGAIMVIAGFGLAVFALNQFPKLPGIQNSALAAVLEPPKSTFAQPGLPLDSQASAPTPALPALPKEQIVLALGDGLPTDLISATSATNLNGSNIVIAPPDNSLETSKVTVRFDWQADGGEPIYQQFFAAATRFD